MQTITIGQSEMIQLVCIRQGLEMWIKFKGKLILTRTATPKNLLGLLSRYTGKAYNPRQSEEGLRDCEALLKELKGGA